MIKKDLTHCKDLDEFYREIRALHIKHHGRSYVDPHDDLMETAKNLDVPMNEIVYRESGVFQGATVAAMASIGVKRMQLIDVQFRLFNQNKKYFKDCVLDMHQCSSIKTPIKWKGRVFPTATKAVLNLPPANIAYFDAMHVHEFVLEELQTHAPSVTDYMFIHDTYQMRNKDDKQFHVDKQLHKAAKIFVEQSNGEWVVNYYHQVNCGYTKLKRIKS